MKQKLVISAGGTSTAWHIVNKIKHNFRDLFEVIVIDVNPPHLIPSSTICDKYIMVPKISSEGYYHFMLELFRSENVDLFIPLIDFDLIKFPSDNPDLKQIGTQSTAPSQLTIDTCLNKETANKFLLSNNIPTPKVYESSEINPDGQYFVKPYIGFGSIGTKIAYGAELLQSNLSGMLIQDLCNNPEVTVEIFYHQGVLKTICRERIEVKAGVCTKARIYFDDELHQLIKKLSLLIDLPIASCIQFMRYKNTWAITDINLRLGAGTALSSCAGWDLTSASLVTWANSNIPALPFLKHIDGEKFIVRYYQEMLM
jgi:carbamoylphosphate synthase large subunit